MGVGFRRVFDRFCMRLYAVYAVPLKGKRRKKDELLKRLHTLHTSMWKVVSALLLSMFPASGLNCIQTAYTVHTNCIQKPFCEENVNVMLVVGHHARKPTTVDEHAQTIIENNIRPNQTRHRPSCRTARATNNTTTRHA